MVRLTEKEQGLYDTLTSSQKKVYLHLRNDRFFFKNEKFFDKQERIAEYLGLSLITVKRAIKRLKEIGLLETSKKWKINYYSLPCYDNVQTTVEKENKKEELNVRELELSDEPDNSYYNLYLKVMQNAEIIKDINNLRSIPEGFRKEYQENVVTKVSRMFGVKNNEAVAVITNIV